MYFVQCLMLQHLCERALTKMVPGLHRSRALQSTELPQSQAQMPLSVGRARGGRGGGGIKALKHPEDT